MRRGLLLLLIIGFLAQVQAHTVQIAWQILQNGKVRVWLEHWHGNINGSPSNFYITAAVTYGGNTTNATYYADGFYNDTPLGSLPESNTIQVLAGCSGNANTYNDWIYFDFNPPACNQAVTITILNGPPAETMEGCSQIFPQTVGNNFDDQAGPIITASDTCFSDQGSNLVSNFSSVSIEDACDAAPAVSYKINGNPITLPYDFPLGTTTVEVVAVDNVNNSSSAFFDVQVMSGISLTHLADVYCADANEGSLSAPSGFSSYSWSGPNGYSSSSQQVNNLAAGNYTATVTNSAGCTFSASETVSILDSVGPTISGNTQAIYLNAAGQVIINAADVASLSDDCGVASSSVSQTSFDCSDVGIVKVEVSAIDNNGNETKDSISFKVIDTIAPVIDVSDIELYLEKDGSITLSGLDFSSIFTDNCGVDTFYVNRSVFNCTDFGDQDLIVTVKDVNGNQTVESFNLSILDTLGVDFFFDAFNKIQTSCMIQSIPQPMIKDNCSDKVSTSNNAVFPIERDTIIEWYFDDGHGNLDTVFQEVVINDTIAPEVQCPEIQKEQIVSGCDIGLKDYASLLNASDNCGLTSITQSPAVGTLAQLGDSVDVVFQVKDAFDNAKTCDFKVVIQDSVAPELICPSDTILYTMEDNCSFMLIDYKTLVQVNEACYSNSLVQSPPVNTSISGQGNIITMSLVDAGGNSGTCVFAVDVVDTMKPYLVGDFEEEIIACNLRTLEAPEFADNCGGEVIVTNDIEDLSIPGPDTIYVYWKATDGTNDVYKLQTIFLQSHTAGSVYQEGDSLITQNAGLSSYQWIDCFTNEVLQDGESHVYVTNLPGEYAVVEENEYGCTAQSDCYEIFLEDDGSSTGISNTEALGIQIYPNPVTDYVVVKSDQHDIKAIKVIDMNGKKVLQHNGSGNLDLRNLNEGIYVLHIQWTGGSARHPFVKK